MKPKKQELDSAVLERANQSQPLPSAEIVRRALAFYDAALRFQLEPAHDGQYIAIYLDTEDYRVEREPSKAFRALRSLHSEGTIVLHHIGIADAGLKARLCGERPCVTG